MPLPIYYATRCGRGMFARKGRLLQNEGETLMGYRSRDSGRPLAKQGTERRLLPPGRWARLLRYLNATVN